MRNNIHGWIAVAVLAGVAACSSDPKQLNPSPSGVSYTYSDRNDLPKVTDRAIKFCSTQGKSAKLENVAKNDDQPVAIFSCV